MVTDFATRGDKVMSVETNRGEIETDCVVCAAGPQTGILAEKVGAFIPVSQGREEIIITAPLERMWHGAVSGNGLYGRQTERGNLAYGGGNHEWVDVELETPEKPNTPMIRHVGRRLAELIPGDQDTPIIRGYRASQHFSDSAFQLVRSER